MRKDELFPDNQAVFVSIPLKTINRCMSVLEPLIRYKYTFAIICSTYGYVVIRKREKNELICNRTVGVHLFPFTDKQSIVRYWENGEEVELS